MTIASKYGLIAFHSSCHGMIRSMSPRNCSPRIDNDRIRTLHGEGLGATEIARQLRIGRSTVYKILNHGA